MDKYKIAECVVEYTPIYPFLQRRMEPYRCGEEETTDIVLQVTAEQCREWKEKNGYGAEGDYEYALASSRFYREYLSYGGFMLHASAVELDERAYLFSADSGVGKSTHTRQWLKLFPGRAQILNDDKPAIRPEKEQCMVWGTPFSGKSDRNLNRKVGLQGICMIERGEENKIWQIGAQEALPLLMRQTIRSKKEEDMEKLLSYLDAVLSRTPVYRMQCTASEEAAKMAYECMKKGNL